MVLTPIHVECCTDSKADGSPRRFLWRDRWLEVVDVLDQWYQGRPDPEWPLADYFKVSDAGGRHYLLKHDHESDDWYLAREWRL